MSPDETRLLYDYNAWANRRVLSAAEKLTAQQFLNPLHSSFTSVRDTLAHIYGAEWAWLERFQGRTPAALPSAEEFRDIARLRAKWLEQEERLLTFVRWVVAS